MRVWLMSLTAAACAVSSWHGGAATWHVDQAGTADFVTIHAAVAAAAEGDEIVVHPGVYAGVITIPHTNLILRSLAPLNPAIVGNTVITNPVPSVFPAAVTLNPYAAVQVSGFTISNSGLAINSGGTNCVLANNVFVNNAVGVMFYGGLILSNVFIGNSNDAWYASVAHYCLNITLEHNFIARNTALPGTIASSLGTHMRFNTIVSNVSPMGGTLNQCHDLVFENNTVAFNHAVAIEQCMNVLVSSNLICGNVPPNGSTLLNLTGVIEYNTVSSNRGSAIRLSGAVIRHNLFEGNEALNGGAILDCAAVVENNIMRGNVATNGGAIALTDNMQSATVRNNLVVDNVARLDGGGIWADMSINAMIVNNTIVRNTAARYGGGMFRTYNALESHNNILWDNTASAFDQYFGFIPKYSCVQDGLLVENCVTNNPAFAGLNDFHLTNGSPCIDTGFNLPGVWHWNDLDGNPRVWNQTVDMGCYENSSVPEAGGLAVALSVLGSVCIRYSRT